MLQNPISQNVTAAPLLLTAAAGSTGVLVMYDPLGRVHARRDVELPSGQQRMQLPVRDLSAGTYVLAFMTGDAAVYGKLIIVK